MDLDFYEIVDKIERILFDWCRNYLVYYANFELTSYLCWRSLHSYYFSLSLLARFCPLVIVLSAISMTRVSKYSLF